MMTPEQRELMQKWAEELTGGRNEILDDVTYKRPEPGWNDIGHRTDGK